MDEKEILIAAITRNINKLDVRFLKCVFHFTKRLAE